jgi:transglutaminase-like putative cysteine protease
MRIERAFLLSFYLSLSLAGACLGYVNLAAHPWEVALLAGPCAGVLLLAYRMEGRWAMNVATSWVVGFLLLGCATAGIWFGVILYQLPGQTNDLASWLAQLLPHFGFWLAVFTAAKLFRPKKPADFWWLHFAGLMAVALACSLESDFFLAFLLLGYVACALWSLACFYLYREQVLADSSQPRPAGETSPPAASAAVLPWRRLGLGQSLRRLVLLTAVSVALYLITPRHALSLIDDGLFRRSQLQVGLGDTLIDLNRTGTIRTSSAVAFEVRAETADGAPKLDLDPDQRWRGIVLNHYESGRWLHIPWRMFTPPELRNKVLADPDAELPILGPDCWYLTYQFPIRLWRLPVLADPAVCPPDTDVPVVFFVLDRGTFSGLRHPDGELRAPPQIRRPGFCWSYRQVTVPLAEPGIGPPQQVDEAVLLNYRQLPDLPELKEWTAGLLRDLVDQRRLSARDVRRDTDGRLLPENREKVARVLEWHLAQSGKYTYSLTRPRQDRHADPVVDFLCNSREGHCERFASGLAVMLRSQGIPARIIGGYRGAEPAGDGLYRVRLNHAHTWVEALVQRTGSDGQPESRWLTLDPTPSLDAGEESMSLVGRWWKEFRQQAATIWQNFVVEYNADQQAMVLGDWLTRSALRERFARLRAWIRGESSTTGSRITLFVIAGLLGGSLAIRWGVRHWRHRRTTAARPELAFWDRWLAVVARRCRCKPQLAQTPREFAEELAGQLQRMMVQGSDFPRRLAGLYYRVRYAGTPLSAEEMQQIDAEITAFDRMLVQEQLRRY